ncbi:hypothetical protein [Streptomyces minutiscleroticus]|uniref:hypothetical protein n=1 Tax=Streptomyces minutiscleroticus TaxID=68238 RepID=UPI00333109E1
MPAAAFLAVQDADARRTPDPPPATAERGGLQNDLEDRPTPIRFSAYEIRRLVVPVQPQPPRAERIRHGLAWSYWRRCHRAVARARHRRHHDHGTARPPPRTAAAQSISN